MPPVRVNVRIRDRDLGFDRFVRNAQAAAHVRLRAGVLPKDAGRRYPGKRTTVGEVAAFNELGTDRRRPRPFLGSWFDRRSRYFVEDVIDALRANLRDGAARRTLRRIADRARAEVRLSLLRFDIHDTGLLERSLGAAVEVGRRLFARSR